MELNVTSLVNDADTMPMLSGSCFELGDNAGKFTWSNSLTYSKNLSLLSTDSERQEARDYLKTFGAWSKEEIAAWTDNELQALIIQMIAGDIREMENYDTLELYQEAQELGSVGGNLFKCNIPDHENFGQWFYYLGE